MPAPGRRSIVFAVAAGFTGVVSGAFGAHALHPFLESRGQFSTWETAVHYHLLHSAVLLALALHRQREKAPLVARRLDRAGAFFAVGIALFSGSLYLLALGAPRFFGYVTPFGGLALLAGWLAVGHALWRRDN